MSTPNPLIPQGTFQAQAAKGASNVRLAVATIVAIHIVFFGGLLLQGCKRDPQTAVATQETNDTTITNLSLGALDSNSMYYPAGGLPSETGNVAGSTSQLPGAAAAPYDNTGYGLGANTGTPLGAGTLTVQSNNADALWQTDNLSAPGTQGGLVTGTESAAGPMKEYTIVKGDTLGAIAKRNHTTVSAIRAANPGIEPTRIRPGQKIQVPTGSPSTTSTTGNNTTSANGGGKTYTVKSGDTLTKIARRHGITINQLSEANNLRTSRVNVGQKLKIPTVSNAAAAPKTAEQITNVF
jgi:LysM repeat protein